MVSSYYPMTDRVGKSIQGSASGIDKNKIELQPIRETNTADAPTRF